MTVQASVQVWLDDETEGTYSGTVCIGDWEGDNTIPYGINYLAPYVTDTQLEVAGIIVPVPKHCNEDLFEEALIMEAEAYMERDEDE